MFDNFPKKRKPLSSEYIYIYMTSIINPIVMVLQLQAVYLKKWKIGCIIQ